MINYVVGDATAPSIDSRVIIAHICNDIGAWGRGFVMSLSKRWTKPELKYRSLIDYELGTIQCMPVEHNIAVCNMIAQHGIRSSNNPVPIRYDALESCLNQLAQTAIKYNASVHMPRIGAGLAGGNWNTIESLINKCLANVNVYVYSL